MGDPSDVHLDLVKGWLDIETLMRNDDGISQANALLQKAGKGSAPLVAKAVPTLDKPVPMPAVCRDGCEVFNAKGDVLGIEFRGRVRGGCRASDCKMFEPDDGQSRACSHCSKPNFDHDDLGTTIADSDDIIVRIRFLKSPTDSLDFLHVELAADSTIQQLREQLGDCISANAAFYKHTRDSPSSDNAMDSPLPGDAIACADLVVSEVLRPISGDMALVKRQAQEAQEMLVATLGTPTVQQALKEMEKRCAGKAAQYRRQLQEYLVTNVYPDICDHFGLPASGGARHVTIAISKWAGDDISMCETWLMLEKMMRNEALATRAESLADSLVAYMG